MAHEAGHRARSPVEVAWPRAERGRAADHDSDPVQRQARGERWRAWPDRDRSRPFGGRNHRGRGDPAGRHHSARAHLVRRRAQAARRSAGGDRAQRDGQRDHPAQRPGDLRSALPARRRVPDHGRRRSRAPLRPACRGAQEADRPHPVRDLDRGDPLLSERHLLPCAGRRRRTPAHRRHRRPSARARRGRAARRRGGHAVGDRAAQDDRRAAQADRRAGRRGRASRSGSPTPASVSMSVRRSCARA